MSTNTISKKAAPFVKWAGGKRQLLPKIKERLPKTYNYYYEPFVGGGALFFELNPEHAVINDVNAALINVYQQLKSSPYELMQQIDYYDENYISAPDKKTYYYSCRTEFNETLNTEANTTKAAALLVYINKHCFNGLYRVNSKGLFNVPFNGSKSTSYSRENFLAVSAALQNTTVLQGDFEKAVQNAKSGDFIFFDSPYAPLNPTSFESYTKQGFSKECHERLANLFYELSDRGCYCMLTNHNTSFIRSLYSAFNIEEVSVRRCINSDASKRTGTEVIIRNYA